MSLSRQLVIPKVANSITETIWSPKRNHRAYIDRSDFAAATLSPASRRLDSPCNSCRGFDRFTGFKIYKTSGLAPLTAISVVFSPRCGCLPIKWIRPDGSLAETQGTVRFALADHFMTEPTQFKTIEQLIPERGHYRGGSPLSNCGRNMIVIV